VANYTEIAIKLQEDYQRMLRESGGTLDAVSDPVLTAFFRTVAHRIDSVSAHVRQVLPSEILDRLIGNLDIPVLRSRPAQTVVRFNVPKESEFLDRNTQLVVSTAGDRLYFSTDAAIRVSEARLAFAAGYENGQLSPLPCGPYPQEIEEHYLHDPVTADLGAAPLILMAFDLHPDVHLDMHGLFLDLTPEGKRLFRPDRREIWCLLDEKGMALPHLMMRPIQASGGVQILDWLVPAEEQAAKKSREDDQALGEGFFGSRTFRFPSLPQNRRPVSVLPERFAEPMQRIFGAHVNSAFHVPRAWVKILLPPDLKGFMQHVLHIWPNTVTASNVEFIEQTIRFQASGTSIPVSNESGIGKHLVRPLVVQGGRGRKYVPAETPIEDSCAGSYCVVRGRLEITPACSPDNQPDELVTVKLLVSDGARGNSVMPGCNWTFRMKNVRPGIRIDNPVHSAGGTDTVPMADKFDYFASMIRSRERLVTKGDLEHFVRSLDRRIGAVRLCPVLERCARGGLERVYRLTIPLQRQDFAAPEVEEGLLVNQIETELQNRSPMDLRVRVEVVWT
jgi:hypothetical protein